MLQQHFIVPGNWKTNMVPIWIRIANQGMGNNSVSVVTFNVVHVDLVTVVDSVMLKEVPLLLFNVIHSGPLEGRKFLCSLSLTTV